MGRLVIGGNSLPLEWLSFRNYIDKLRQFSSHITLLERHLKSVSPFFTNRKLIFTFKSTENLPQKKNSKSAPNFSCQIPNTLITWYRWWLFKFLSLKVIGLAEKWALQESGVQIILCTCAASGSPRIVSSCDNIQQCIVDECGMCMEPESLVPITCSGAKQVVLIGDHKQLQPVIQDHVAKTLGLSVSMFERHSKRATMLELQYRMVRYFSKTHSG